MSFLSPKCRICRKQEYFGKTIYIILTYFLTLFIVEHAKKSLQLMQRNRRNSEISFLDPKWTISLEKANNTILTLLHRHED